MAIDVFEVFVEYARSNLRPELNDTPTLYLQKLLLEDPGSVA